MASPGEITALLQKLSRGDKEAQQELIPHVYKQLRLLAANCLRSERPNHSLQATALIHEAYLKIIDQDRVDWQSRAHFFAVAAKVMRRILVDHARQRLAQRRGGGAVRIELDESLMVSDAKCGLIADLHEALERLEAVGERPARIVEMRFFAGMTEEQIGEILGIATRTVKRDWKFAKAWLHGEMVR